MERALEPDAAIASWCGSHNQAVRWDPDNRLLLDVYAGKVLSLPKPKVADAHLGVEHGSEQTYLLIVLSTGEQIALARPGIAFPPDMRNSGPLPGIPQVVCFRDFQAVMAQVRHAIVDHPDTPPSVEVLDMVRYLLALLDGARNIGFDVGEEERQLDRHVNELERRAGNRGARAT